MDSSTEEGHDEGPGVKELAQRKALAARQVKEPGGRTEEGKGERMEIPRRPPSQQESNLKVRA